TEEAQHFTEVSEELGAEADVLTQVLWRGVRSRILAAQGRIDEAEELARQAVTIGESTDFLNTHADALVALAEIRGRAGRGEEASAAAAEALALCERKGNRVVADRIRAQLSALSNV